jgi:predicted SAM-dependent methyltransferase
MLTSSKVEHQKLTLNVGCGGRPEDKACYLGDVRIDIIRFPSVTTCMSAENLGFIDNVFDEVYCFEVLEHLISPFNALKEIHRVIKPNGRVVVTVPNVWYWRRIYHAIRRKKIHASTDHKQAWDIQELINLVSQIGLKIKKYGWIDWYHERRKLKWIDKLLPKFMGKTHMYAIISKENSLGKIQ